MAGTLAKSHRQTDEVMATVCQALRSGLPLDRAFRSAGISKSTGHAWRQSGWRQIEMADANTSDELSYVARFAVAVEASLIEFMAPLIRRFADGALGKNRGDWRACKELLAARFPDEFSERTHVAKSQRVEIGGSIEHGFSAMRLQSMSDAKLQAELESCHWSLRSSMLHGGQLGEVISYMEDKLSLMRHHYEGKTAYFPDRNEAWRPGSGRGSKAVSGIEAKLIEHEDNEICAAVLQAPDTAEGPVVVAEPSATPPRLRGPASHRHWLRPARPSVPVRRKGDGAVRTPEGFIAVITDHDALPVLIAAGEIAVISKLAPQEVGAKAAILLKGGYRLMVGTEYSAIAERLAASVGTDKSRKGN